MCRSKADGGRLCPCQSSARRSAKYKAKKAAVALGNAPTIGARNVSDAPAGVFPEGMPARESFEKLRAGWDADAAKDVIATVNGMSDSELEGAAGDAIIAAYPDMMAAMLSGESKRGLDGVSRCDAVRAVVAVEVGCALAAEADRDVDLARAREQLAAAKGHEEALSAERKKLADTVADLKVARDAARERGEWDKLSELSSELAATEGQLDSVYERWFASWRKVVEADSAVVKARQESYTRLLAQVRDMGGGFDAKAVFAPRSSRDGKKLVQDVSRLYPTDWNQSFSSPSHNRVKMVLVNDAMGASLTEYGVYFHVAARGKDGASVGELRVVNRGEKGLNEATMCHEMMHRMERTVPSLVGAEQAFLRYRARDTNYDTLYPNYAGKDAPEGYSDSFPRAYAGRIYDTPYPYAFEVMSAGVEHVFYGNTGDLSGEDDHEGASPSADREYRGFVLGALASL
mgnify:FL=1